MKLLLLIMLAIFSFASTQYKTPVFVVEKSTLYCLKYENYKYGEIVKHNPGDLVSGDYASSYCSYNSESIIDKIDARILELKLKAEDDKKTENSFGVGSFTLLMLFIALIFICLPTEHIVEDQ